MHEERLSRYKAGTKGVLNRRLDLGLRVHVRLGSRSRSGYTGMGKSGLLLGLCLELGLGLWSRLGLGFTSEELWAVVTMAIKLISPFLSVASLQLNLG